MSDILGRLKAALKYDVINGDRQERAILESQIKEGVGEIESLRSALYTLQKQHRWIPIKELLPEYNVRVLIRGYDNGIAYPDPSRGFFATATYWKGRYWTESPWRTGVKLLDYNEVIVTHWKPITFPSQEGA